MANKVTLKVTAGPIEGREFVFEDHDTFLIGRSDECQASLPGDQQVSRHHFILEVNPPDACIRDLGSLNGTYVNDAKHGGREKGETPEEGAKRRHPEVALKDGDQIRVGSTALSVVVEVSRFCCECGSELSGTLIEEAIGPGGTYTCPDCKKKLAAAAQPPKQLERAKCKKCGRDVSKEVGAGRQGDYVCVACRANVMEFVKHLLNRAKSGDPSLTAIQGYSILKRLGVGGMGEVYLARNDASGEQVALKVMLPKVAAQKRAIAMFEREVEVSKALRHPKVVEMRDHGCSDGTFFFTLEFCDGGSVDQLMGQRGGRLPIAEAGKIMLDVLDGLQYAHRAEVTVKLKDGTTTTAPGVVHRDLSPHNIFLTGTRGNQVAKVADFGLAKGFETAGLSGQTRTGTAAGKPWFMPRQQVINFKYSKPEVDVWGAAACLYNMLTGQFPRDFPAGQDPWQIVLGSRAVPILKRDPSIPKGLAAVIDKALIDEPAIPFKTAAELKHELERVL